jgi:hypothetical protein
MLTMGGSEQTTPVQAMVMMLLRPPRSWQVTSAAGTGERTGEGVIVLFFIESPLEKKEYGIWKVEGGRKK